MKRAVAWEGLADLAGLTAGPAQVWGGVRLVPLLREEPIRDLRLHAHLLADVGMARVALADKTEYVSYVPHAFVATWTDDGTPAATYGTQLPDKLPVEGMPLAFKGLVRRGRGADGRRLRFLPQHLAMEGYLALHFGGPTISWEEWTHKAVTQGLSPRTEASYAGAEVPGLDDALRIFEIHPGQCGLLLFVADALAGAFVVPHPDDYRALHPTLIQDCYGDLIAHYAYLYPSVAEFATQVDADRVHTVADLRGELARAREGWREFTTTMTSGLLDVPGGSIERVYEAGRFTLWRFLPGFDPDQENHIGELITDATGRLAYLKTFRLSGAQIRRGYLLTKLAEHHWQLDAAAAAIGTDRAGLVGRLNRAGFGSLLRAGAERARTSG